MTLTAKTTTTAAAWSYSSSLTKPSLYHPPSWAKSRLTKPPTNGRLSLANLPTPVYRLVNHNDNNNGIDNKAANTDTTKSLSILATLEEQYNVSLFVKRDDMTGGVELGGNKVRKLEFLLADALQQDCDSVVTIGGEQSNHCRATAAAARMLGLEPHLVLRTKRADRDGNSDDFGFVGNILVDRMIGSHIYACTPGEVCVGRCESPLIIVVQRLLVLVLLSSSMSFSPQTPLWSSSLAGTLTRSLIYSTPVSLFHTHTHIHLSVRSIGIDKNS